MMEPSMMSGAGERPLPQFFVRWRAQWGDKAADWTPTDYLNQQSSIGPAIAAGWLFNPATVRCRTRSSAVAVPARRRGDHRGRGDADRGHQG
jgi:hypothetical protein